MIFCQKGRVSGEKRPKWHVEPSKNIEIFLKNCLNSFLIEWLFSDGMPCVAAIITADQNVKFTSGILIGKLLFFVPVFSSDGKFSRTGWRFSWSKIKRTRSPNVKLEQVNPSCSIKASPWKWWPIIFAHWI